MLDKMRQRATEAAHKAAEEARIGARHAAEAASRATVSAIDKAGEATAQGVDKAIDVAKDPATHAKAKIAARGAATATAKGTAKGAASAGRAVKSALDKLNPELLAGVVLKATTIQEQANVSLKKSGSLYRISGIAIGAAFPPSVSFQIGRLSDLDKEFIEQPDTPTLSDVPSAAEISASDGAG